MLFWIILILTIGSIVWWILSNEWAIGAPLLSLLMILILLVSLGIFGFNHANIDGIIAKNTMRYEMLVYQYENNIYDNDNDLGKRDLMLDIQDWNEDLIWNQAMQKNFWLGIYIPDIFDQFEFIELTPQND